MSIPELRPYQIDVIAEFHSRVESGRRRIILVAPTGSGKTIIGAEIIREKARARKPVLVLAHRREIITQTSEKLHDLGIVHGIIQAGLSRPPARRRAGGVDSNTAPARHPCRDMDLPPADLLVIDEATIAPPNTYRKIIDGYPERDSAWA